MEPQTLEGHEHCGSRHCPTHSAILTYFSDPVIHLGPVILFGRTQTDRESIVFFYYGQTGRNGSVQNDRPNQPTGNRKAGRLYTSVVLILFFWLFLQQSVKFSPNLHELFIDIMLFIFTYAQVRIFSRSYLGKLIKSNFHSNE